MFKIPEGIKPDVCYTIKNKFRANIWITINHKWRTTVVVINKYVKHVFTVKKHLSNCIINLLSSRHCLSLLFVHTINLVGGVALYKLSSLLCFSTIIFDCKHISEMNNLIFTSLLMSNIRPKYCLNSTAFVSWNYK